MRTKKKILNEKFKDSIPSDFEGEVWDKRLLEAMDEYANDKVKCEHDLLKDALIESHKAIKSLGDLDLGVTYTDSYPGDPPNGFRNKDALLHQINKALKKSGCEL